MGTFSFHFCNHTHPPGSGLITRCQGGASPYQPLYRISSPPVHPSLGLQPGPVLLSEMAVAPAHWALFSGRCTRALHLPSLPSTFLTAASLECLVSLGPAHPSYPLSLPFPCISVPWNSLFFRVQLSAASFRKPSGFLSPSCWSRSRPALCSCSALYLRP